MGEWIAKGAELAWLIDPFERSVTIYRSGAEPQRLESHGRSLAKVRLPVSH